MTPCADTELTAFVGGPSARCVMSRRRCSARTTLELFFVLYLRMSRPSCPSPDTVRTFEALTRRDLVIGDERWSGWALDEDDVWVLEARGHTPDEVLFPQSTSCCTPPT
jgi:hypothetical protein